jgi:uncharacterized membrane protein
MGESVSVLLPLDSHETHTPLFVFFLVFCVFLPMVGALSSYYEVRGLQLAVFLALGLIPYAAVVRSRSTTLEDQMFQTLIWSVSVSLILSSASVSQYLSGWEIQREFAFFQQVSKAGFWNLQTTFYYNSVISISILPTMVQAVSGLAGQEVFKFVYALVFSVVPLVLYNIYRRVFSPKSAFLSAYLLMSYWVAFSEIQGMAKQEIGELLLVLLFWILISGVIGQRSGTAVALLLSLGVVVSHYTLSYIYIAFLAFSIVTSRITRRVAAVCSLGMIAICSVMTLGWYMLTAKGSSLMALTDFLSTVAEGISRDLLNPGSRPLVVMQAAGLSSATPGLLHDLYRLTNYVVQFCMLVGFIVFARKRNKSLAERRMLPLMTAALMLLGSAIILPLFRGIPFTRIYHISLLLMSPCFVLGVGLLGSWWRRASSPLTAHSLGAFKLPFSSRGAVAATILLSYFLFSSGWVWAVSLDRPTNVIFDGRRMADYPDGPGKVAYYGELDMSTDVNGALWLKLYAENARVCADVISSYHVLTVYGEFYFLNTTLLRHCNLPKFYMFLSEMNILHAIAVETAEPAEQEVVYQISTHVIAQESSRLYSNGGTAIYARLL